MFPCAAQGSGTKGPFSFAKENGPFETPRERLPLQASSSKSCNACRLRCPDRGVAAFSVARRFGLLLLSVAALPILWECTVVSVYRQSLQCGERSNAAFRKQSAAVLTSLAPHDSKARLRLVSIRRRFMAKPCTPHLHCAARAVLRATNCQCAGSRGTPLAFSWGFKGAILSRERMAPFAASPHGVGINPQKYHFLNFLIVSAMIFCFKIMLTST